MTIGKMRSGIIVGIGFLAVFSMAQYHENGAGYVLMQAENTKSPLDTWKSWRPSPALPARDIWRTPPS